MTIHILPGTDDDALAALDTICRSVTDLCVADHQNDRQALADWLGNKTPDAWAMWIARADARVLVAQMAGKVVGVGMIDQTGQILLNYVHPEARFTGVSTAILAALEDVARGWGLQTCLLTSTKTAHGFYLRRGYQAAGDGVVLSRSLG